MTQGHNEVTITETLLKTVVLVVSTSMLIILLRTNVIATWLDSHFLNLRAWKFIYEVFNIQTAVGREQCMMTVLVVICFTISLGLELALLRLLKSFRKY